MSKFTNGLVITVYNRPQYLKQCLDSLLSANINAEIVIVDDCSTDEEVQPLIKSFKAKTKCHVLKTPNNSGVSKALLMGFDYLVELGCTRLMNLDADAIVAKNFFQEVESLHQRLGGIVTGFNTLSTARNRRVRHPILRSYGTYCQKKSIGGINMVFSTELYLTVIKQILHRPGHWDWNVVRYAGKRVPFYCTTPSVVQHIGIDSAIGNRDNPDVSFDFRNEPMKKVILQAFGLGDIVFCQSIANKIISDGGELIWPVLPQFYEQVKRAYPKINFVLSSPVSMEIKDFRIENGYQVIPLRFSDTYMRVPYAKVMRAKYDMMGMDYIKWTEGAKYERDLEKEKKLAELVGAEGEYCLVNPFFTRNNRIIDIPASELKQVNMREISGYSLFDWSTVIENATEIHTVSTSIVYLFELLDLKCKPYIYVRRPIEKDHSYYNYLLKKPYNYV